MGSSDLENLINAILVWHSCFRLKSVVIFIVIIFFKFVLDLVDCLWSTYKSNDTFGYLNSITSTKTMSVYNILKGDSIMKNL